MLVYRRKQKRRHKAGVKENILFPQAPLQIVLRDGLYLILVETLEAT